MFGDEIYFFVLVNYHSNYEIYLSVHKNYSLKTENYRFGIKTYLSSHEIYRLNLDHLLIFRRNDVGVGLHAAQGFNVGEHLRFFAVNAENFFDVAGNFFDVSLQFIFVRMAGIGVQRKDFGFDLMRFAENVHGIDAGGNFRAERAGRAIADEQNEIVRVADVVGQMMPHATGLAHARGADDNHAFFAVVELLGIFGAGNVGEILHAERIFAVAHRFINRVAQTFRMLQINVRGMDAQRAVHKNRRARQFSGAGQFVQHINNLLRATDGKRGNNYFSILLERFTDGFAD